jgi:hypothetical protein
MFSNTIKKMMDKNNCYDIFQESMVGNRRMYEEKTVIKRLRYKFDKRALKEIYDKLDIILGLRAVSKELFILL